MDLKCLSYFIAIIDSGSFGKASARLRIAQPALGWQIRKLEEELGTQLMIRHSRGVEPTEAGLRLLSHARAILARTQEAIGEVRSFATEPQGTVVLGMTPSVNALLTVPLLKQLALEAPLVKTRPVEELSAVLTEWVSTGRLDLAIVFTVADLDDLCCEPLLGEAHYFVESPRRGAATAGTISFAEAAKHELVMTVMSHRHRTFLEETARARGVELNIVHQMQSVATLRDLVAQGVAATILPFGVVAREVSAGTLVARRIVRPEINRVIYLASRNNRQLSREEQIVCKTIRRLVKETMAKLPEFWVPIQRCADATAADRAIDRHTGTHVPRSNGGKGLPRVDDEGARHFPRTTLGAGRAGQSNSFDSLLRR